MPNRNRRILLVLGSMLPAPLTAQTEHADSLLIELLTAEDRRPTDDSGLEPILVALAAADSTLQRFAVRALGRLERPEFIRYIEPALESPWVSVRVEAANAMAQAVFRGNAMPAATRLTERLTVETDGVVIGALAQAIGRLPYESASWMQLAEYGLSILARSPIARDTTLLGVARGLESLLRRNRDNHEPSDRTVTVLHELARFDGSARIRRLAVAALTASDRAPSDSLLFPRPDPDPEVRRLAVAAWRVIEDPVARRERIEPSLADPVARVRYEAWRIIAAEERCDRLPLALSDESPHIALLAVDLYGACPAAAGMIDTLAGLADSSRTHALTSWHARAHALVALAKASPSDAASRLDAFAGDRVWQVRMYAARAATELRSSDVLEELAGDEHHNVREAAIRGLAAIGAHEYDSIYVAALASADYQLLLTSARALAGSPSDAVVPTLFSALRRITEEGRETSRDTRAELLERIGELGGRANVADLEPFVRDFDPAVAAKAAEILTKWTGTVYRADPPPLSRLPFPSLEELRVLESASAIIQMEGGDTVELRLLPFDAPTNAARFARLARDGYFDGLTFHRVVPNFVIQGGSPGANEYAGDGRYTRDELTARSHLRGTVGLSTRGRDTGDAQIFINLVDNVRLDHNYTIFAEVVTGMDVVDRVLEGAVIERITIRR